MTATHSTIGRTLFLILSAPIRYIIWQFDLDDSKEKPSLLKMASLAIIITVLVKMGNDLSWTEFLALMLGVCAIASRKTLEKFADRITGTISGSHSVSLSGDLTELANLALANRDPERGVDPA